MRASRQRAYHACLARAVPNAAAAAREDHRPDSSEQALEDFVVAKWCAGDWRNSDISELSYLVTKAHGRGLQHLALNPTSRGRNDSRKVQSGLDVSAPVVRKEMYFVDTPVRDKATDKRIDRSSNARPTGP